MQFRYTKFKTKDPNLPFDYQPLLDVKFFHGKLDIRARGMLDTGATITLINKSWAEALRIDWKSGKEIKLFGIVGEKISVYMHEIEMEVMNLENSRKPTKVAFIDSPNVGILLGQIGFFENFNTTFSYSKKTFHVNPV